MTSAPIEQHHPNTDLSVSISAFVDAATVDCITTIAHIAESNSVQAFLVGGILRDIVAGIQTATTSPDIVVIGDAASFANDFALQHRDAAVVSTSQFCTAKVKIGTTTVDFASARIDKYDPPGSLPQVTLVDDINFDLCRRDYTVNSMALPLCASGFGELIDPFDGQKDAMNHRLRVLHKNSFAEDPLRMLRGARLAARYGYTFTNDTEELILRSLNNLAKMVETSPQRIFNEFQLWFDVRENLPDIISTATRLGLLQSLGIDTDDIDSRVLHKASPNVSPLERFAAFVYCLPKQPAKRLTETLQMPSEWRSVAHNTEVARSVEARCAARNISDVELRDSLITLRDDVLRAVIAADQNSEVTNRFRDFRNRLKHMHTALNGKDLIDLGIEPGPLVGQMLNELLTKRIDGTISTVEDEQVHIRHRLTELRRQQSAPRVN